MEQGITLLLLLVLVGSSNASTVFSNASTVNSIIGEPFELKFPKSNENITVFELADGEMPKWLLWENNTLYGVPTEENNGRVYFAVKHNGTATGDTFEIHVHDEVKNPCGDKDTLWVEFYFDRAMSNYTAEEIQDIVKGAIRELDVDRKKLRVYSAEYLSKVRGRRFLIQNEQPKAGMTVVTCQISCGVEDEDELLEIIDEYVEKKLPGSVGSQITSGKVKERKQRHEGRSELVQSGFGVDFVTVSAIQATTRPTARVTAPTARATAPTARATAPTARATAPTARATAPTARATAPTAESKPMLMNRIESAKCVRGQPCEILVPNNVFYNAGGGTSDLDLSLAVMNGTAKWLELDKPSTIRGIPLENGIFNFRLDARNSKSRLESAPFEVTVTDPFESGSHEFVFEIKYPYKKNLKEAKTFWEFYKKLQSLAVSISKSLEKSKKNVVIKKFEEKEDGKYKVTWFDPTLHEECRNDTLIKNEEAMNPGGAISDTVRNTMGSDFPITSIKLELSEKCKTLETKITESTTTSQVPASEPTATLANLPYLVPLAVATVVLLLVLICLTTWCIMRRKSPKTVQSDFVSKGLPVVFPEEIPQEDETATASTPMLVKEERPPLLYTQHENPLYKPPPPLSTASSPRPRNTPSNQRVPPPYVPP